MAETEVRWRERNTKEGQPIEFFLSRGDKTVATIPTK